MTRQTALFIEFSNIDAAFNYLKEARLPSQKTAKIDYVKFIQTLTLGHNVFIKNVYIAENNSANGNDKFISFWKKIGFDVITKKKKIIKLDNGETKCKANFDVEITFDACSSIWKRECDRIILVSGDSDFSYLIRKAKDYGIKVTVVASSNTISTELRNDADNLILIDDLDIESYILKNR